MMTDIAIAGLGTVGSGVVEILNRHADRLSLLAGSTLRIHRVLVRDAQKPRPVSLPDGVLTADPADLVATDYDVLIELMGGTGQAADVVRSAISAGKSVVTANKALIAEQGQQLFQLARENGASIAFDAAVAGGIPIVTNLMQCLAANRVESICGILNGTCNYILTQMEQHGASYRSALADAQQLGYAEADPAMDVDGTDATQKLSILARIAMQVDVDWQAIPRVGIERIDAVDIAAADYFGHRIRLVGMADRRTQDNVALAVSPTLFAKESPLASVTGPDNAVLIRGDAVGEISYRGPGAGKLPTASAVVADLIDTVAGRSKLTFEPLQRTALGATMSEASQESGRHYLRCSLKESGQACDEILAKITEHGIAIAASVTSDNLSGDDPFIAMITEACFATKVAQAIGDLEQLEAVAGDVIVTRVAD